MNNQNGVADVENKAAERSEDTTLTIDKVPEEYHGIYKQYLNDGVTAENITGLLKFAKTGNDAAAKYGDTNKKLEEELNAFKATQKPAETISDSTTQDVQPSGDGSFVNNLLLANTLKTEYTYLFKDEETSKTFLDEIVALGYTKEFNEQNYNAIRERAAKQNELYRKLAEYESKPAGVEPSFTPNKIPDKIEMTAELARSILIQEAQGKTSKFSKEAHDYVDQHRDELL